MIEIRNLAKEDARNIVEWNQGMGADFLEKWTGRGYRYPITEEAIKKRIEESIDSNYKLFKIIKDVQMIGTIELMNIDEKHGQATVGRFLLAPEYRGRGYGTQALIRFANKIFEETSLQVLELYVFKFNKNAIHCYEKAGFHMNQKVERYDGKIIVKMKLLKQEIIEKDGLFD